MDFDNTNNDQNDQERVTRFNESREMSSSLARSKLNSSVTFSQEDTVLEFLVNESIDENKKKNKNKQVTRAHGGRRGGIEEEPYYYTEDFEQDDDDDNDNNDDDNNDNVAYTSQRELDIKMFK
jgi:hypothetical protein